MAIDLRALPFNILVFIFEQFDQKSISSFLHLINSGQDDILYQVATTIKFSKVIVSNEWQSLIRILPRALKLMPLQVLDSYMHISLADFRSLAFQLPDLWDARFPIKRSILIIIRCDLTNQSTKYKTLRDIQFLLHSMPPSVHNAIRLVNIGLPISRELVPYELNSEITTLLFQKLACDTVLHQCLESLVLHGCVSSSTFSSTQFASTKDFSHFKCLSSLHLNNLGLETIQGFCFPNSLVSLSLAHNRLQDVKYKIFPRRLKYLDLSNNVLRELNGLCLPQGLRQLNVSRNLLRDIVSLPSYIEDLDISFNDLTISAIELTLQLCKLSTDIAQFYLMPESMKQYLAHRQVMVSKHAMRVKDLF